jgi:hypothetical protein
MAAEPERRAAVAWLLEHLIDAFDLRDEPALAPALAAFRAGRHLDPAGWRPLFAVRDRLWLHWERHPQGGDMAADPGWRRAQAGWALAESLGALPMEDPLKALQHARLALGERWPAVSKDLKARLRS